MSTETNSNEEVLTPMDTETTESGVPVAEGTSIEQVRQLLVEEQQKSASHLDSYQRARADYENLKRRTQAEKTTLNAEARERILVKLLPVVDDFERALQSVPENLKNEPWLNGVSMIEKKLKTLLDQEAVAEIPSLGEEFNPRFHEAVHKDEDGEGDKDVVTAVYQKGYKLGDKVIRAAVVKVGRQ